MLHLPGRSGILPLDTLPIFFRQGFQILFPTGAPAGMPFPDPSKEGTGVLVVFTAKFARFTTGHFFLLANLSNRGFNPVPVAV
jgi:hypothetical protein